MNSTTQATLIKVPAVTLGFWIIKILATTLGETGGDAVSMSMDLGYLISSALFMLLFVAMVLWQIRATDFQPLRYWATILASTTVGTTLADFATRSLGIGYGGGTLLLLTLLALTLVFWHRQLGSIDITSVSSVKAQFFYWVTIMFSQTLGTALGDWTADSADLGYLFAAGVFGSLLLLIVLLTYFSHISRTALFWAAFVLTRPLGAVVGDFLDKPVAQGGLDLSRYSATAALLTTIVLLIVLLPQRAALKTH
ncbi:hypothetical protein [Shewanella fodinae]|uniref:Putative membrane-anchored protein n=1 Tax=Shewanella fodinae TaxID=552357 RepID=A0A4R2FHF6_9GAMM|nr:hypothetical protein [Shewanella fodinae]TCN90285.1 putative membrane-anchored protein [Shewanella fodinae]